MQYIPSLLSYLTKYQSRAKWIIWTILLYVLLCTSSTCLASSQKAQEEITHIRIGVLAKRGDAKALQQWKPTADYLSWMIAEVKFTIVPLDFNAIYPAAENKNIDLILTNSAFYVGLVHHHQAQRLLTLKNKRLNHETSRFGGVIFTRADNDQINTLEDIRKKVFMAVDRRSFGGWLMAWNHLLQLGINPEKDFKTLQFGGTHDAVVRAVADNLVDAGTVRTDTLERMAKEGKINMKDFKILAERSKEESFPFVLTTALYPEWPIAALPHVPEDIVKQVIIALLQLSPENEAAKAGKITGWVNALDYSPVRQCLQNLRFPPFEQYNIISWQESVRQYWRFYVLLVIIVCVAVLSTITFFIFNRRLHSTMAQLDHELTNNKYLAENLQEFKLTLDQTLDCVFMFDPKTLQYIYANQGAVDQVGYSLGELLGMTPHDLTPELDEQKFREIIAPLAQEEKKSIIYSTNHLTKDGSIVPVEIVQQYVELSKGNNRFIAIVRDITERLAKNKEKEQLQTRLLQAQKLESVGQLAAGIAHEINTPTQFIGTNIEFLDEASEDIHIFMDEIQKIAKSAPQEVYDDIHAALEEADWEYLAEELPQAISQSRDGVKRVSSIVMAMKEFSHPGSKEKVVQNLNKIISTTVTVARNEWKYVADMEINLDINLPSIPLLADEMGQVILNILVNAAHAIDQQLGENQDGKKGTITITTKADKEYVELRIDDNGTGMTEEIKARIFDPFFTTKKVGRGTGQGLAISHDVIVEKHGGTVLVESVPDQGTAFIIKLPLQAGDKSLEQSR